MLLHQNRVIQGNLLDGEHFLEGGGIQKQKKIIDGEQNMYRVETTQSTRQHATPTRPITRKA